MTIRQSGICSHPDNDQSQKNTPLIQVEGLGINYTAHKGGKDDYKSHFHRLLSFSRNSKDNNQFWALKDVNLTGYPGETLGIIGANGAGKSTLCRVFSGLLLPDKGRVVINGKVSSLLSIGTGFINELTGRENIALNGMMLGFSQKYMREILLSIEEFSGLGDFLEQPIKFYSSGMKARLGFSIAAAIEADILVIDEVLGTGDIAFMRRAKQRMREIVEAARMVVVVSHSLGFINRFCTRAIWIDRGEIKADGKPTAVTKLYKEHASSDFLPKKKKNAILEKTTTEAGLVPAIEVEHLSINYKIGRNTLWALKNVSFKVCEREILGIIGANGAGKSTLCRSLCGLYAEDEGRVTVHGEVTALLGFGSGFNVQLSGRDNIYLNGMMLGIPRKRIRRVEKEIIDFSGLGKAIEKPVKHYSGGMKSRLAFSIAAMLKPDIFIVDEALSAGDYAFQEKATRKMQSMLQEAKAVVIVTHSLNLVEKVCSRAIWLNKGELLFDGEPKEAVRLYQEQAKTETVMQI